jgi:hypothetical protein
MIKVILVVTSVSGYNPAESARTVITELPNMQTCRDVESAVLDQYNAVEDNRKVFIITKCVKETNQ